MVALQASTRPCQHANRHSNSPPSAPVPAALGRRTAVLQLAAGLCMLKPLPAVAKPSTVIDVDKAQPGERDVFTTATGLKYADAVKGTGDPVRTGDLILVDVVGQTDGGKVFLDTRGKGAPLAFQAGTMPNKYVPEGLLQAIEGMNAGGTRLAVIPAELGYGDKSMAMPGATVPANSKLYYEIEVLRCQNFTMGLACCSESQFTSNQGSCIGKKQADTGQKP